MATHEDISVSTVDQQTELKCDICYETPDHEWEIIGFGCCRGKFCKECISKMMDSKDCPMCRTEKPVNFHKIVERKHLEEVYEHVFGDDAINRYTHEELIAMLDEMYDCYISFENP